ncbi:hypothetical protein AAA438_03545 [Lactobacillus crispatus]|jgi:hypothetical protein|uniref:hypothetical protein n=1 Tax=Lactobacillus crispatus TaxID=47770 RepID=UPI0001BAE464|nr:hypothetical protein HMPREF0508_00982 [Lactobacillus crispatus MV-3A-US]
MKLLKTKILTILCGLLTLNGLAMLFSGLIIQMDEVADFDSAQSLAVANSTNAIILAGIIMILLFGHCFSMVGLSSRTGMLSTLS